MAALDVAGVREETGLLLSSLAGNLTAACVGSPAGRSGKCGGHPSVPAQNESEPGCREPAVRLQDTVYDPDLSAGEADQTDEQKAQHRIRAGPQMSEANARHFFTVFRGVPARLSGGKPTVETDAPHEFRRR